MEVVNVLKIKKKNRNRLLPITELNFNIHYVNIM